MTYLVAYEPTPLPEVNGAIPSLIIHAATTTSLWASCAMRLTSVNWTFSFAVPYTENIMMEITPKGFATFTHKIVEFNPADFVKEISPRHWLDDIVPTVPFVFAGIVLIVMVGLTVTAVRLNNRVAEVMRIASNAAVLKRVPLAKWQGDELVLLIPGQGNANLEGLRSLMLDFAREIARHLRREGGVPASNNERGPPVPTEDVSATVDEATTLETPQDPFVPSDSEAQATATSTEIPGISATSEVGNAIPAVEASSESVPVPPNPEDNSATSMAPAVVHDNTDDIRIDPYDVSAFNGHDGTSTITVAPPEASNNDSSANAVPTVASTGTSDVSMPLDASNTSAFNGHDGTSTITVAPPEASNNDSSANAVPTVASTGTSDVSMPLDASMQSVSTAVSVLENGDAARADTPRPTDAPTASFAAEENVHMPSVGVNPGILAAAPLAASDFSFTFRPPSASTSTTSPASPAIAKVTSTVVAKKPPSVLEPKAAVDSPVAPAERIEFEAASDTRPATGEQDSITTGSPKKRKNKKKNKKKKASVVAAMEKEASCSCSPDPHTPADPPEVNPLKEALTVALAEAFKAPSLEPSSAATSLHLTQEAHAPKTDTITRESNKNAEKNICDTDLVRGPDVDDSSSSSSIAVLINEKTSSEETPGGTADAAVPEPASTSGVKDDPATSAFEKACNAPIPAEVLAMSLLEAEPTEEGPWVTVKRGKKVGK